MDSLAVTAGFEIRLTSAQSQLFCFLVVGPGAGLSEPVCFSEHRKGNMTYSVQVLRAWKEATRMTRWAQCLQPSGAQ